MESEKQRETRKDRKGVSVMDRKVTKGNVFKDLGFTDEEAIALAMRVDLAVEIEKFIKRKRLTQTKAAAFFDVPQPKISKIIGGKVSGFSIERPHQFMRRSLLNQSSVFRQISDTCCALLCNVLKVSNERRLLGVIFQ